MRPRTNKHTIRWIVLNLLATCLKMVVFFIKLDKGKGVFL